MAAQIPDSFTRALVARPPDAPGDPDGNTWLDRLPRLVDDHLDRWDLTVDGDPWHGHNALVVPVRRGRERAALKLTWPHPEARHEHLALRLWDGDGAVRLLAADPAAYALLLERLDGDRDLTTVPVLDACEVIGGLLPRLDRPATPQLDTLQDRAVRWRQRLGTLTPLVPRRFTEQALAALPDLLADAPAPRLVHEDLHDINVLAPLDPARGDWLAIDPKPVAGEWAYAVAPVVWNRPDELARAHNLRAHVQLRADVVGEAAGLDPDRVRAWTFVRLVLNAVDAAAHAPAGDEFRSRMIALAKAFAD
jgi:streptomycin 6-kinase